MADKQLPKVTGEPIPLNLNPLNQLAKQALNQEKADADPYVLYSLQLAQWVLEDHLQRVPAPASDFGPELLENVNRMQDWEPLAAQTLMLAVPKSESSKSEALFRGSVERTARIRPKRRHTLWFTRT